MELYIYTFGAFDIKFEGQSLLKDSSRSYKLYKLLQYFITFKNKKILSDTIIENIWPEHESYDPDNMLRAQIYRLRQFIKSLIPEGQDESLYMKINFNNGYYSLDVGERVVIDSERFEDLISLGDGQVNKDINSAINYYERAIELYKGEYLEENAYELWLVPSKNYYEKLYVKKLFKLLEILKEKNQHQKIIEISQNAIIYEPQDENIHIYLMEAMLKLGQTKDAASHYEYTNFLLNQEGVTNISSALHDINRKIQNTLNKKSDTNIVNIKMRLQEDADNEVLVCDFEYFKFLFNIQKRKRNIEEEPDFITLISLDGDLGQEELRTWKKTATEVLKKSLRWGDIFTFWNESQILILLQNVQDGGIANIEARINENLTSSRDDIIFQIKIKSTPIMSKTEIIQEIH